MRDWDVVQCSNHHFRWVIYGLGPYIADYPEQTAAAGTVYNWCVTLVIFNVLHYGNLFNFLGVTLNPTILTIRMQTSGHKSELPPSSMKWTQSHCGMIMGLFQTSRCVLVILVFQHSFNRHSAAIHNEVPLC